MKKFFMQSSVNQNAIKLTVQTNPSFLQKLLLAYSQQDYRRKPLAAGMAEIDPVPDDHSQDNQECTPATNLAKESLSLGIWFQKLEILARSVFSLDQRTYKHWNCLQRLFSTLCTRNRESQPAARDKNGEHVPGKEKKERNERQRGLPIYPTTILRDLTFTPPGCCCLVAQLCPTLCNPVDCCQAPPSMEFSRREYWSGLPCPPPGNLPNPGIKSRSPALQADSVPLSHKGSP